MSTRWMPWIAVPFFLLAPSLQAADSPTEPGGDSAPEVEAPEDASMAASTEAPPGYEQVTGPASVQESVEPAPLVVAAYMLIWSLLFAYLMLLGRRQSRIDDEIRSLAQRLEMERES